MTDLNLKTVRCIPMDEWDDLLDGVREIRSLCYVMQLLFAEIQKHSFGDESLQFALFDFGVCLDTVCDRALGIDLFTRRYDRVEN